MKAIVLLALFGVALASYEATFHSWMVENGRRYATPEEYQYRLKVFSDNAALIERENAMGHSWTLGFNSMADLTLEEYRAKYLRQMPNETAPITQNTRAVTNVDWRTSGCVTAVKDQGQCGSCYSFSATASMEFCHCHAGNPLVSLSEQHCVDCSMSYGNLGCSGGWQENCWKYYIAYGGEDTEASYPYTAVRGTCKASTTTVGGKATGWSSCTATEAGLQSCVTAHVTSVAIDASLASFQLYKSGIYCPTGCSTTALDHAVTAVGQQTSASGDYYIVKNSWGTSWGQAGYIWMCANHNNNCGICTHANYPTGC